MSLSFITNKWSLFVKLFLGFNSKQIIDTISKGVTPSFYVKVDEMNFEFSIFELSNFHQIGNEI